jgi:hypothetical protein
MELLKDCKHCGSTNLESGELRNNRGPIAFKLAKTPFFTLTSPDVRVDAVMCLDCGTIQLIGDTSKARQIATG